MADFDYKHCNDGFTMFMPNTKEAEHAFGVLAEDTFGTGKVLTFHHKAVIAKLRKAGYTVAKAKPTKISADDLFAELFN